MRVLDASGLTKIYHRGAEEVHALRGVSLSVQAGEFVSIVGPSGSGKTALLNLLGCLDTPTTGTLSINGIKVTNLPESQRVIIRREEIGFVFQQFFLIQPWCDREYLLPLTFSRNRLMRPGHRRFVYGGLSPGRSSPLNFPGRDATGNYW